MIQGELIEFLPMQMFITVKFNTTLFSVGNRRSFIHKMHTVLRYLIHSFFFYVYIFTSFMNINSVYLFVAWLQKRNEIENRDAAPTKEFPKLIIIVFD
jgi:hypothetical protein